MTTPLRVLIADAAPLQRAGLRAVLTNASGAPVHFREHQPNGRPAGPGDRQEYLSGKPDGWADDLQQPVRNRETRIPPGRDLSAPGGEPDDRSLGRREIVVAGEAVDGVEAVDLARRLLPDVLITDAVLPRLDGLAATRAITEARLSVPVLILTGVDSDDEVTAAMSAGAAGYLRKDSPHSELLAAVYAVAAGGAVITPQVLARVLSRLATALSALPDTNALSRLTPLTAREREVLIHVARGHSNSEIAGTLGVSETTVKTHVGHVLTKLRLRDRTQAVILAYETGLVHPRT